MIRFYNGHQFDFGCAAGALGFRGDGYPWEWPLRWAGVLRPDEFTVIAKTVTYQPRKGNFRWWCPWRTVGLIPGGAVNAMGLPNPGYKWWLHAPYQHCVRRGYKVIPSIAPFTKDEAKEMVQAFNRLKHIVGIQVNLSCPNVARDHGRDHLCEIGWTVLAHSEHPVIFKLSWADDFVSVARELDAGADAFELINTVPFKHWTHVMPLGARNHNPIAKYGYEGGVSGTPIKEFARSAIQKVKAAGVTTPIISGGGIDSMDEVVAREALGAEGFVFGTLFLRQPWLPNHIAERYRAFHRKG